jgi:broad specificity phosphatase PhoE
MSAKESALKKSLQSRIWEFADETECIVSATLVGSFLHSSGLEGISDIDLVIIADPMDESCLRDLTAAAEARLAPPLQEAGFKLHVNTTLGPLKFNDADTAVLHMMVYTPDSHAAHVINSPFTCLDWQQSGVSRKRSLAEMYPVFGLQPRHFQGARRSAAEYLNDYMRREISYRELVFEDGAWTEVSRVRPMTERDRHEFAYHIVKNLMRNALKLLRRPMPSSQRKALLTAYLRDFHGHTEDVSALYQSLAKSKTARFADGEIPDLDNRLLRFVTSFQEQFQAIFEKDATRHIFFRHAETERNSAGVYLGRHDCSIFPGAHPGLPALQAAVAALHPAAVYSSPRARCQESLALLENDGSLPESAVDGRLREIEYGACEGLTVSEARARFPALFDAWSRGEDPAFPGGENTAEVAKRLSRFLDDRIRQTSENSLVCTHNVVLRTLIGAVLGVPSQEWYKIRIPHLAPIGVIATKKHGLFLDLDPAVEEQIFAGFRG